MKAAYILKTGPPENIIYGDVPDPRPGPTQCLVKVGAVAVNPVDTYIRGGLIQMSLPSPFVVGCDLAGTVVEVGSEVTRFEPGDRVWGSNQGLLGRQGTFAEYCAADECWLYPTGDTVPDESAASLALVGITAHLGLARVAAFGDAVIVGQASSLPGRGRPPGGSVASVFQLPRHADWKVGVTAGSAPATWRCRGDVEQASSLNFNPPAAPAGKGETPALLFHQPLQLLQ